MRIEGRVSEAQIPCRQPEACFLRLRFVAANLRQGFQGVDFLSLGLLALFLIVVELTTIDQYFRVLILMDRSFVRLILAIGRHWL